MSLTERKNRERLDRRAAKEADWFYRTLAGRASEELSPEDRDRALTFEEALQWIPSFQRGALALAYREKEWPLALHDEFGELTSLVVRLECARVPSIGTTDAVEAAAVERLLARIACGTKADTKALVGLAVRAFRHRDQAIHAVAEAWSLLDGRPPVGRKVPGRPPRAASAPGLKEPA